MVSGASNSADASPQQQTLSLRQSEWVVILFNDDYTPFDWVVALLMTLFERNADAALRITDAVHRSGKGIGGVYEKDRAIRLASEANKRARDAGHPFRCEAQPLCGSDDGLGE